VAALIPPGAATEPGHLVEPAIAKVGLLQSIERELVDLSGQGALVLWSGRARALKGWAAAAAGPDLGNAIPC
jgi:hypothetical protein